MTIFPASQNRRRALLGVLMLICAAALLAVSLAMPGRDVTEIGVLLGIAALMGVLATMQVFALDEAQKKSHYSSWYWGSCLGSLAVLALYYGLYFDLISFAPIAEGVARAQLGDNAEANYLAGLITAPFLCIIGFAIWQAAAWLRQV